MGSNYLNCSCANRTTSSVFWARSSALLFAIFSAVLVAACSPHDSELLQPPDMTGELANANLSPPPPPRQTSSPIEYASGTGRAELAELYPGNDVISKQQKKVADLEKGVTRNAEGYQINFSDAELSQLTKAILQDTLGVAFIFDPRVQGRVTVSTGGPVSRRELLTLLESVLLMFRGALIVDGNLYRIVPATEAGRDAILTVDYAREAREVGPGYGVSILPLKYVSSETMMRLLDSLAPNQNRLQAVVQDDLLIIRGTGRERESILQIAYTFDVDWMKGQSAGILTLENSTPEEVIGQLEQVFQADGKGKGLVRFQAIKRLNAVLVLTQKSKLLDEVSHWVSRLDRGGPEAENYYVYRVEYGRAADLAEILMATFTGKGLSTRRPEGAEVSPTQPATRVETPAGGAEGAASMSGGATLSTSPDASEGASPIASGGTTGTPGASTYRRAAAEAAGSLVTSSEGGESGKSTGAIQITPDERNNKLLIKASGRDLRIILGILRRIDKAPLQVLINATLAEVTLNDNLRYGVQVFLQNNCSKIVDCSTLGYAAGQSIDIAPVVPGLSYIVGALAPSPKVVLDALATATSVRVVSSPSVVVLHNQPATLMVGDKVPYTVQSAVSVLTPGAPVVNSIQYQDTGVTLKVIPKINSNGLVTMAIEQEISTVAQNASADTLTPTISQRHITSTIAVQSGQMVVLGGLISETNTRTKHSIPVLGKIPYIGEVLGGDTQNEKTRTELIVFLQPSVIHDPVDASGLAEEMRSRMQSLAPRAAAWDAHVEEVPQPKQIIK